MLRNFAVFVVSLIVLISILGCQPPETEPSEPNRPGPTRIEPPAPEPDKPDEVVLVIPEPNVVEPDEPVLVEPNDVEPVHPEPNDVRFVVPEPNEPEPNEPCPVEPNEPVVIEPNDTGASVPEPNDVEPVNRVAIHDRCGEIFKTYVNDEGFVDYKTLTRQRLRLKRILNEFHDIDPEVYKSWPENDKIAFWINVYNIQMLNIITTNYPIRSSPLLRLLWPPDSIRHIKGIWSDYKCIVMDEEFNLATIDRRFFRNTFNDPRVFLALSHAGRSGPPLRNEAYYGYRLDRQLDDQVRKFLSSPQGFRIDYVQKTVYISSVFDHTWHGGEFIRKYGIDKKFKDHNRTTRAVLNFITNYISQRDISFLEVENYSIKYVGYDWRLNDGS